MSAGGERVLIHGVLLSVAACGTLVLSEPGVGKSLLALELIAKGHKLVADDSVELRRSGSRLVGAGPRLTYGILAVRPLGLIDVRRYFGNAALSREIQVDLCVHLSVERSDCAPENFTSGPSSTNYLGVSIPEFQFGTGSAASWPTLVEAAVHVRRHGRDTGEKLVREHSRILADAADAYLNSN